MRPEMWKTWYSEALRVWGILKKKKQLLEIQTWARSDDFVRYGRRALIGWVESWDSSLEEGRRFSELAEARPVVCGGGRTW